MKVMEEMPVRMWNSWNASQDEVAHRIKSTSTSMMSNSFDFISPCNKTSYSNNDNLKLTSSSQTAISLAR